MKVIGECFCGSISYAIDGPLKDPLACHCSRCRKVFSAQSSNYSRVESGCFEWLKGEQLLTHYLSQQGFGLAFCSNCGSTLIGTFENRVHGITLGCLNSDPDMPEIHHIYVDSKAGWDVIPDDAIIYSEGRSESDHR